ncbi:MAG TPA: hypothetical protein VK932_27390 [Kofleriaceae bacterium]|nr:hypothetical protein [Kofleriaceae bacterium]
MYRDSAHRPADHDRAVGAIQIADGLIADCTAAAALFGGPERHDRWTAVRTLHDGYPELWNQLDGARRILAARGANTAGYDELRGDVSPLLAVANLDGSRALDPALLDDARRALEELRLAMPGADWQEIDAQSRRLAATRIARRGRLVFAGIVCGAVLAFSVWGTALMPRYRPTASTHMRVELTQVVVERRARIDELSGLIDEVCDRPHVLELLKLYVMDGRFDDARAYADRYETQCGEDSLVRKWGHAPKPKRRD